jgi:ABC-type uncharacterized transport system ATPase subunit
MERGRMVRSGRIEDVTAAEYSSILIKVTWTAEGLTTTSEALQKDSRVSDALLVADGGTFRFSGSQEELAELLADLIANGVRVSSFAEVKQTVQDIYMKISTHEVM